MRRRFGVLTITLIAACTAGHAQTTSNQASAAAASSATASAVAPASSVPVAINLHDAIERAERNEPSFAALRAEQKAAKLERGNAKAALLPSVLYHNQVLYTQPNGANNAAGAVGGQPAQVFLANNAVHEYTSQASITETIGLAQTANVRVADAAAARATAELEVGRRGLVAAVATLFYGALAADRRLAVLNGARDRAEQFVTLTRQREDARESAHADVVKADLTLQQRTRDVADGALARDRARLELAVLLFADPLTPFTLDQTGAAPMLPAMADVQAAAQQNNPELANAFATMRQSNAEVQVAQAAYLPDLSLNFTYGIDAAQFATRGPIAGGIKPQNLGYSIAATVDIPVWDWLSTERRVKQSEVRRDAVRVALTAAQRRLVVNLQEIYNEAQMAQSQLASLDTTVRTAEESLHLTELRYGSGEATVLEVVDGQATLLAARTAQQDGQVRFEQALANLQTLTGSL